MGSPDLWDNPWIIWLGEPLFFPASAYHSSTHTPGFSLLERVSASQRHLICISPSFPTYHECFPFLLAGRISIYVSRFNAGTLTCPAAPGLPWTCFHDSTYTGWAAQVPAAPSELVWEQWLMLVQDCHRSRTPDWPEVEPWEMSTIRGLMCFATNTELNIATAP